MTDIVVSDWKDAPLVLPSLPSSPRIGSVVMAGICVLAVFLGGLGAWSFLAPLSSGAVAPGVVKVAGHRKTVQHLEGGIIDQLLVADGDRVEVGDVLVRLDTAQTRSSWQQLRQEYDALEAQEARLIAERDGRDSIDFPAHLAEMASQPRVDEILEGQRAIFAARKRKSAGQVSILEQKIEQLHAQIASLEAQMVAAETQKDLTVEEAKVVKQLLDKGLERRPRFLALQRGIANFEGARGELLGLMAKARQEISETKLHIIDLQNEHLDAVVAELRDVQTELGQVAEKMHGARDVLDRSTITAPIDGTIMDLRYFTQGGVIKPGDAILDIVPKHAEMVIEAYVKPTDIDIIQVGQEAEVRLTALKQRTTPTVKGDVIYISADSLQNADTGESYFVAQIEIRPQEIARLHGLALDLGMPVQSVIVGGERTLLQYLMAPIQDSLHRALREQ